MVVDASAIVTILKEEPGHQDYGDALAGRCSVIGATTLVETKMVLSSTLDAGDLDRLVARLLNETGMKAVDFTPAMADAAVIAFRRFGKGRGHPARLNFGDCMSYAVAKVLDAPLLYKGDDFARTDIPSAIAP